MVQRRKVWKLWLLAWVLVLQESPDAQGRAEPYRGHTVSVT